MNTATMDRNEIVIENLGLVRKMANKYIRRVNDNALDFDDLYGEGCVGLIEAAERFDPTKGYRFSTFACSYISGFILRSIRRKGFVSVPHHVVDIAGLIVKNRLEEIPPELIAERLGYKLKHVHWALHYLEMRSVSMDIQLKEGEGDAFDNFVPYYEDFSTPFVQDFMKSLNDKNLEVLNRVMAGKDYRTIGNEIGVSLQAVGTRMKRMKKYMTQYQATAYGEA